MDERDTLEFYRAADGVRWRYLAAGNHEIMADGGQGYERLDSAREGAFRVLGLDAGAQEAIAASGAEVGLRPNGPVDIAYSDGLS